MSKRAIASVSRAFEYWRRRRRGIRVRTPDRLRKMAVALCMQYDEKTVRSELGLGSRQIWEWKREFGEPGQSVRSRRRKNRIVPKSYDVAGSKDLQFIDVTPKNSPVSCDDPLSIEWSRVDGSKMKLTGIALETVARLAGQFLSCAMNQGAGR